jgi:hypothetical protein
MATCLFRESGQVCGKPAIDEVGISPPGGGEVREIPACERHLQSMVETYFSKAAMPVEAVPGASAPPEAKVDP